MDKTPAQRLERWLDLHAPSRRQWCISVEIAPSTLCRILKGERTPTREQRHIIAQHARISADAWGRT